MHQNDILRNTADAILDQPAVFEINITPRNKVHELLQKAGLAKRKLVLTMEPLKLGTMIQISKLILKIDIAKIDMENASSFIESAFNAFSTNGDDIARAVAYGLHNKGGKVPEGLVELVKREFTSKDISQAVLSMVRHTDPSSFLTTIISVRKLNVLEMSPQDQGRSIASGKQSGE